MTAPYLGDFAADQAINFMWSTNDRGGASITRATDGTISVYKDNSDGTSYDQTQVTTGVTNDEDMDSLTGIHSCNITTTDAWYEVGHDYAVVLSASTIDGQTVNAVLATFSIENRLGAEAAGTVVVSSAKAGTLSVTQMSTNLTEATNDHYIGRTLIWTSGALKNQATDITDYVGVNGVLTFTAVTDVPSDGDTFVIV